MGRTIDEVADEHHLVGALSRDMRGRPTESVNALGVAEIVRRELIVGVARCGEGRRSCDDA